MSKEKVINEFNDITSEILKVGKENGEVSINDIANRIEGHNFSIDDLEILYQTLEKNNIKVVNENSDIQYTDDILDIDDDSFWNIDENQDLNLNSPADFSASIEYLNEIKNLPVLSDEEEEKLLKIAANGDDNALKQLLESNLRLSAQIAKNFSHIEPLYMDLVQEGNLGLLEAIKTYNSANGQKFKSYATELIKKYISAAIADYTEQMEKPVNMVNALNDLMRINDRFYKENGRQATFEELADEMSISEEEVKTLLTIAHDLMKHNSNNQDCD